MSKDQFLFYSPKEKILFYIGPVIRTQNEYLKEQLIKDEKKYLAKLIATDKKHIQSVDIEESARYKFRTAFYIKTKIIPPKAALLWDDWDMEKWILKSVQH